jgi:hypothetical protein
MRITNNDLINKANELNTLTDSPPENRLEGHHSIMFTDGGVQLVRKTKSGGYIDVLNSGFVKRPVLWALINAYMEGIRLMQERHANN